MKRETKSVKFINSVGRFNTKFSKGEILSSTAMNCIRGGEEEGNGGGVIIIIPKPKP
jgi:hypothetical protein